VIKTLLKLIIDQIYKCKTKPLQVKTRVYQSHFPEYGICKPAAGQELIFVKITETYCWMVSHYFRIIIKFEK
jgi:hypothetical protein